MQGFLYSFKHLVLIALILRAMLPAGWMPDASGNAPLVICSVDAPSAEHDGKAPAQNIHQDACPFSGLPHLASTPDVPTLIAPGFHAFVAATDRVYAAQIAARHQPQSPRAPPLSA